MFSDKLGSMHWKIQTKTEELSLLVSNPQTSLHPVAESILVARGYVNPQERDIFLNPDYDRDVHDPFLFKGMEKLVERVKQAQEKKEIIGIFGDFDADGVTSSVLLRTVLDDLGIANAVYLPDKLTEGHGLNTKAVDFFKDKKASIIFTLDCGMMNHDEVQYANELGIDLVIVDHHHVPEVLPLAFVIINPKLKDETYPFRELCGAGTTFKVVQALIKHLLPENGEQLKWLLDIVAIGTVADVMPLIGENRVLVKYGLLVLSKTRNLGLQALLKVSNIDFEKGAVPDVELIAFQIAPRINAASRMAHARIAHDLLMAKTSEEALSLAKELHSLNVARQKQSGAVTKEIIGYFETEKKEKHFLFAAAPEYPYGIIGLVAGRIAHLYQKPTAILTKGETISRGSFRGVPGFSIIEALEECSDLLHRYGGHEQAAGMHLDNTNLDLFEERFNTLVEAWKEKQPSDTKEKMLLVDAEVLPVHIGGGMLQDLKKLAPFGEGNREPVIALRKVQTVNIRTLGKNSEHLKLTLKVGEKDMDAIGFHLAEKANYLSIGTEVDIAFALEENVWNGRSSLQLKLLDLQIC